MGKGPDCHAVRRPQRSLLWPRENTVIPVSAHTHAQGRSATTARPLRRNYKSRQKKPFLPWKAVFFPVASACQWRSVVFAGDIYFQQGQPNMATAKKAPAKTAPAAKKAPATKAAAPAKKRTPNAAFMKALTPSAELAAVVGAEPLPRTEIISKLWVYIKANNLQDAKNKRNINADAKLKPLFGKAQVSMFELAGLIGKHVK
jgi:upstream activation factor subunit UAF30